MARVTLRLLGGFEARIASGPPLVFPTRKTQALLAYLALAAGTAQPRDKLTALLWGDSGDRQARHSLRQALSTLRKVVALVEGEHVTLEADAVRVDAGEFEARVQQGTPEALERAMELYRGDLLEGLAVREAGFEEWLLAERERLRELALQALARLVTVHDKRGAVDAAIRAAQRLLALDPLQEVAHRALMRLYARDGRRGAALRQYQACLDVLQRELGTEPEPRTREIYHELLRRPAPEGAAPPASRAVGSPPPGGVMIGRDDELARLRTALVDAAQGRGSVAAIVGEAGAGKSRLVAELASLAEREGARVITGRAWEMEGALPLGPWIDAMQLSQSLPSLAETRTSGEPDDPLRLFEAITQLLSRLASTSPLLAVLEDLHWADEMSVNLLSFVARQVSAWSVLLVVTAREEEITPRLGGLLRGLEEAGALVRLGRLSQAQTEALVRALSQPVRGAPERRLLAQVWALSEGNPFMIVEAVRAAGERARARPSGRLPLPERIRGVVLGRIERLGDAAQRLVAAAAVIGRAFEFTLLARVAGLGERAAAEGVEELVRRRVLRASGESLEFTHDSIRQVGVERLLEPTRRALHRAVAEALEAAHADRPGAVLDRLAHHSAQSGDAPRAVRYLTLSAEAAYARSAIVGAIRSLEQALVHAARLPAAARERARLDVSLRLATALSNLGKFAEILALLQPLAPVVARVDDALLSGLYHFRLALTQSLLGRHDEARQAAQLALDEAARSGDAATRARAHYVLAVEGFSTGAAVAGVEHGRRAVALLEPLGDRRWLSLVYWILGMNHFVLGEREPALDAERRAEALAGEVDDASLQSFAAGATAWMHLTLGDLTAGREAAQRALDRAPDAPGRATAQGLLAYARLVAPGRARPDATALQALEAAIGQLGQFRLRQVLLMACLAEAHQRRGDLRRAQRVADECLALGRRIGFAWGVAAAERLLGGLAAARGAHADARAHLEEALRIFERIPAHAEVARTRAALAAG